MTGTGECWARSCGLAMLRMAIERGESVQVQSRPSRPLDKCMNASKRADYPDAICYPPVHVESASGQVSYTHHPSQRTDIPEPPYFAPHGP